MLVSINVEALESRSCVHKNEQVTYSLKFLPLGSVGVKRGARWEPPVLVTHTHPPHLDHIVTILCNPVKRARIYGNISVYFRAFRKSSLPTKGFFPSTAPKVAPSGKATSTPKYRWDETETYVQARQPVFIPSPCCNTEEWTCIAITACYYLLSSKLLYFYTIFNTNMPYFSNTVVTQCENVGEG